MSDPWLSENSTRCKYVHSSRKKPFDGQSFIVANNFLLVLSTSPEVESMKPMLACYSSGVIIFQALFNMQSFQRKGYGSKLMDWAESLAPWTQVKTVSCRVALHSWYGKRGYTLVKSYPATEDIPGEHMNRHDVDMMVWRKKRPQ